MLQAAQRLLRTPVGVLRVTASERGVTAIERVSRASVASRAKVSGRAKVSRTQVSPRAARHADTAVRQLREYFAGTRQQFDLPLNSSGTAFQQKVWQQLIQIPFGETITYLHMAKRLGNVKSIRAAASANGKNPLAIIIPCHRVVGADGKLTGYAGGLHRKQWLLEHEGKASQLRMEL